MDVAVKCGGLKLFCLFISFTNFFLFCPSDKFSVELVVVAFFCLNIYKRVSAKMAFRIIPKLPSLYYSSSMFRSRYHFVSGVDVVGKRSAVCTGTGSKHFISKGPARFLLPLCIASKLYAVFFTIT